MSATTCVQCGKTIPGMSKLAEHVVSASEANERNWACRANLDGTVTVRMCIQCQIQRAEATRQRTL